MENEALSIDREAREAGTDAITRRMPRLDRASAASILIVDADPVTATHLAGLLESGGFTVMIVPSGHDALTLTADRYFPVVITGWRMPSMNGIALAESMRDRGAAETCILMLSADEAGFDYERAVRAGIDDYLDTALTTAALHARIAAAVNTAALRTSLKETKAALLAAELELAIVADRASPALLPTEASLQNPKALLVGADEAIAGRMKAAMAADGYEVFAVGDGAAALNELQKNFVSIVIVDWALTDMAGGALCRAIRQRSWNGYVYLMLMTQDGESDGHLDSDAGADEYVSRHEPVTKLVARIRAGTCNLPLERSLANAHQERRRMSMTDPLTGVHNRRYFTRYLGTELKRARRFAAHLSLLSIDIDQFKLINENYGHPTGDAILQAVADTLQKCLPREYDWFARLGADLFAVVLPQTELAGAAVVAEKLRRTLADMSSPINSELPPITASIGISGLQSLRDRDFTSPEQLLGHADEYRRQCKSAGGNCVNFRQ